MNSVDVERQTATSVVGDDLEIPEELSRRRLRTRLVLLAVLVLAVVAIVTLLPGLEGLRTRLSHARPGWLALGVGLKVLSGLGYVAVFRMVFCRRMSWRVSYQVGMSELGANALFPTGGAGGLALGAWALKRGGMAGAEIARRTVAFFLLTSVPNVVGVIVVGLGLAVRVLPGETNLLLTLVPALIAAMSVVGALLVGRAAAGLHVRLQRSVEAGSSRRAVALLKTLVAVADGVNEAVALLREANAWLFARAPRLPRLRPDDPVGDVSRVRPSAAPGDRVDRLPDRRARWADSRPRRDRRRRRRPGGDVRPVRRADHLRRLSRARLPRDRVVGARDSRRVGASSSLRRTLRDESAKIAVCAPQTEMEVIGLGRCSSAHRGAMPGTQRIAHRSAACAGGSSGGALR